MMTEQQVNNLTNAVNKAKYKQDKVHPMVINREDGRLMPNNAMLRAHKNYVVYTGPLDADLPSRMRWLKGLVSHQGPKVVNSAAAADNFDVGKATKEEIVGFAMEQYGAALDPTKHIATLRKEVMALYEKMNETAGEASLA